RNREPSMSEITTIGLDLAKHVFQVHGIDGEGTTVLRKRLRRSQVLGFFSRLPRCVVGLEACATAHYWARELVALGYEVRLMPAQYVKAYVKRNKNDAADAEAICEAVQRPTMRFVPVKTAGQQAAGLLHRGREQLLRQRTMLVNSLRAHLAEFGIVAAQGLRNVAQLIAIVRDAGWGWCRGRIRPGEENGRAGLPRRGTGYLRGLLINGASANLLRSKATKADPWVIGIRRRRPPLVVAVALANKTARIAWAVMLRQREYQPRAVAA